MRDAVAVADVTEDYWRDYTNDCDSDMASAVGVCPPSNHVGVLMRSLRVFAARGSCDTSPLWEVTYSCTASPVCLIFANTRESAKRAFYWRHRQYANRKGEMYFDKISGVRFTGVRFTA
jgi:hypothetical protein